MKHRFSLYFGWLSCWLLAAALPLISTYAKNYQIFSAHQLGLSAAVLLLMVTAFHAVYYGLAKFGTRKLIRFFPRLQAQESAVFSLAMALGTAAIYLRLMLYSLAFAMTRQIGWPPLIAGIVLLFLFSIYTLIAWRFRWKGTSVLLLLLIGWQVILWTLSLREMQKDSLSVQVSDHNQSVYNSIQFKAKPNIYFIVLESYQSPERLKNYYGLEISDFTRELSGMGFFLYPNTHANYYVTVQSLHATFSMQHHYNLQEAGNMDSHGFRALLSGGEYNPVLSILKNNGYRIEYQLADTYLYFPELAKQHLDELMVDRSNPFHPLATLAWPLHIKDRMVENYRETLLRTLFQNAKTNAPRFVFIKSGVFHLMTPQWPPPSDSWKKSYVAPFETENRFLSSLCRSIQEKDPGAVVILAGDHGAFGYSWGWWDQTSDPNSFFKEQHLDPIEVAQDNTDVFLAIKLDRTDAPPLPVRTLVNLFRELFLYLSDSPTLADTRVPDDSYSPRRKGIIHRIVRGGQPLAEFETIRGNPELQP